MEESQFDDIVRQLVTQTGRRPRSIYPDSVSTVRGATSVVPPIVPYWPTDQPTACPRDLRK